MRPRLETIALGAAAIAVAAFVVSFALGLRGARVRTVDLPRTQEPEEIIAPVDRSNGRRVEVLNASRRSGIARQATLELRDAGYDVVYYGNASAADEEQSMVLDRVGDPAVARGAARVLGITAVDTRIDSTRQVEASIILSSDWRSAPEAAAAPKTWRERISSWLRPGS